MTDGRDDFERRLQQATPRLVQYLELRTGVRLRQRVEPEDALQETLLAAWSARDRLEDRGDAAFAAWLCRIAEHVLRGLADYHGAARRAAAAEEDRVSRIVERYAGSATGPHTAATRGDQLRLLRETFAGLDEAAQSVMLERMFLERSTDEVAERLGKSPSTVRRLLARALLAMGEPLRRVEESQS